MSINRLIRHKLKHLVVRTADIVTRRRDEPVPPLPDQLTDAARVLIHHDRNLAMEVASVIDLARGDIPDALYGCFEDLLITCDSHYADPDGEHAADIRAHLALIKTIAAPAPARH